MGHNWQTGETITAALLNGVAQVADLGTSGTATGDALKAAYATRWGSTAPGEAGIPRLMSSPPTIAAAVPGNPASTIPSNAWVPAIDASNNPNTAAFTFRGGPWHRKGTSGFDAFSAEPTLLTGGEGANFPYIEFTYYGTAFEYIYKGQGYLVSRVWVDGQLAENTYTGDSAQDGAQHLRKVTFASAGWRRIRIDLMPAFMGLNTGPGDVVIPASSSGDRLLVIHDSYGEGVGATDPFAGYVPLVGQMLGFNDVIDLSQGGTGVLQANTNLGRPKYRDRQADWAQVNATHVLVGMSINDDGFTAASVAAELGPLLDAVRALPTVRQVWVMGPAPRNDPQNADRAARDAVYQPVAAARGATYVSLVSPTSMWTGATTATLTWQSGGTSQHPTDAGHAGIARTFVNRLLAQISV